MTTAAQVARRDELRERARAKRATIRAAARGAREQHRLSLLVADCIAAGGRPDFTLNRYLMLGALTLMLVGASAGGVWPATIPLGLAVHTLTKPTLGERHSGYIDACLAAARAGHAVRVDGWTEAPLAADDLGFDEPGSCSCPTGVAWRLLDGHGWPVPQ